jgi:hypothetical protein
MSSYIAIINQINPIVFAHKGYLRPYACLS